MKRASTLLAKMKLPRETVSAENVACAAWASAVGKRIARHTRAEKLAGTRLVIAVDDPVWKRQLLVMSQMILGNLERSLGSGLVSDLEFRVSPPRRGPHRAGSVSSGPANRRPASTDEADLIDDPGLRRLYVASR